MEQREHFDEINALVASIAKAHGIEDKQASTELESGIITLAMERDENDERYISAMRSGVEARIYQGVIRYAPGVTPPTAPAGADQDAVEVAADEGESCGAGSSCCGGHHH